MDQRPTISIVTAAAFWLAPALVQCGLAAAPDSELSQNFAAEHEIGRRFHFDPADLLPPKAGPIVTDRSLMVPYAGQTLQVPPGFVAEPYATGLANPRRLLVLPNSDVLVAEQSAGYITLLRDDGKGHAKWIDRPDGIWMVPNVVGALRPGRPVPTQRADQVPPEQRKGVPGA